MGTLFPDSDDYPDHQSIPSPLPEINVESVGMPLAMAGVLSWTCPALDPHDHAPHHDTAPTPTPVQALSAIGSTSANPFFGNTTDAADQVIRRWQAERHRLSHIASMPLGTNPALLFLNDSSSERST